MKKTKKLISVLLSLIMFVGITAGFGFSTYAGGGPDAVEEIHYDAYFALLYDDGTAYICMNPAFTGKTVEIPSEIKGHTVTFVYGPDTCNGNNSIEKVILPNTIEEIGGYAFTDYSKLISVVIPDSCKSITWTAFAGCSRLEYISIPENVNEIGFTVFWNCDNLSYIAILNKNCKIGDEELGYLEDTIDLNATIIGYKNSTAEKYAIKYNRQFIALDDVITEDGTNLNYTLDSGKTASVNCNFSADELLGVAVDGEPISETNYLIKEGSTIIEFKSDYLETLKPGNHSVAVVFNDDVVVCSLNIAEKQSDSNPEIPTEKPSEPSTDKPTEKPSEPSTDKPTEKPSEPSTDKPTEKPSEPSTDKPTEKPSEPSTDKPTEKPSEPPTDKPTEKPSEPSTNTPSVKPDKPATNKEDSNHSTENNSAGTQISEKSPSTGASFGIEIATVVSGITASVFLFLKKKRMV